MPARLTAQQKVARDAKLIADRAHGLTFPKIATRYGLSQRQCRDIVTNSRPPLGLDYGDPVETVADGLAMYDAVIEDLALLAETTSHDAVRLGAINSRLKAIDKRAELARGVGLLPYELGLVSQEFEMRHLIDKIIRVLGSHPDRRAVLKEIVAISKEPRVFAAPLAA